MRRDDNRDMRGRSRLLALLAASLMLCAGAADLLASAAVMACCQKTDFTCAGMRTPDDCCRSMRHAGRPGPATARSVVPLDPHPVAILPERPTREILAAGPAPVPSFARPHDPPHLHAFVLLI
jgi:hypothetical protein